MRPFACWNCGFISRQGHGCVSLVNVLSGSGFCVGLITRPEEFCRLCCEWVWLWSLENEETLETGCVAPWDKNPTGWSCPCCSPKNSLLTSECCLTEISYEISKRSFCWTYIFLYGLCFRNFAVSNKKLLIWRTTSFHLFFSLLRNIYHSLTRL